MKVPPAMTAVQLAGHGGFDIGEGGYGGWAGEVGFPRKGADLAGRIVAVGGGVDAARIGEKVT